MPWKKFKVEGGWKNWKVDEQGKKVGGPLSRKPMTEEEADAQSRALYANEKKETWTTKEGKLFVGPNITQHFLDEAQETGKDFYELLHAAYPGAIVTFPEMLPDELRDSKEITKDFYDTEQAMPMMPMGGACSWEEMDAMEAAQDMQDKMYGLTDKMSMMARNAMQNPMIDDKAQALMDIANGFVNRLKKPDEEKSNEEIARQIAGDNQPDASTDKATWTTAYQNNLPDSSFLWIAPGGDRDSDGKTTPRSLRYFPYKDANGKVDLPHLRNAIQRIPQAKHEGLTPEKKNSLQERARKLLESADKKELYIWKEGDTYRWLAAYSNNRRDNDNPPEIITTESHKEFDEALTKGEWPMPELWLWHIPYSVGITQYHAFDESAGFPIAAGVFNKGCEWAAEGVLNAEWDGVSHGMPSPWIRRDEKDASHIVRHRTKEITFLPTWAAANKLAFNIIHKESEMTEEQKGLPAHKREEFIKAFGEERVKQIETALEATAKAADEAGVEKKEETPTEATPKEALTPDSEIVKALGLVMETITAMRADFDNRLKAMETYQAEQKETEAPFDLVKFLKDKSTIGQETAKVDGRSILAKDKPQETKTQTGSSFTENFMKLNQAWYEQGGAN